jgi:hypothetical protein
MDWRELRVRLGQEAHKHGDLLLHRLGRRNGTAHWKDDNHANGDNRDQAVHPAQSFFSNNLSGAQAAERAQLVIRHLPEEAAEILREADDICHHRFRLLGYHDLDFTLHRVGDDVNSSLTFSGTLKEIDWHLDPVHGKRAPLDAWFKIPFLDFAVVGDHKVTWELNRHQHLVTLAKARLLSGDEKYTRELMAQWRSWIKANPYPLGINWGSTLEVAFRSLSWTWVDQLLSQTPEAAQLHAEILPALAFHGRYIERYLSTYFSPNTHLLGEAVALFFLGTLYPRMPHAERWRESGWQIALHEAERQVRPDGVYFEQSLYYHVYALDFFLYARLLAARNGREIPSSYDAVLARMLEVVAALAQAGPAEGFGDDDGGRLWNPRRNRTEHMTDPLALGAILYARNFSAARLTEESIWLFGNDAVAQLAGPHATAQTGSTAHSVAFPDGGLYILADAHPHPHSILVDAGPQGVGRSGHGHADALSLRLTMNGQRWLVDSGSGVYISKNPADRNTLRGTAAHNTLRVDGMDQAIPEGPFAWTHIPETVAENWVAGKSFTYFVGSHNGYSRLPDPVLHRRHVLKIAGDMALVRDVALGRAEHELEIAWHFAPDLEARLVGAGRVQVSTPGAAPGESSAAALSLIVPEDTPWQRGTEVTSTRISPAYGAYISAPLVRCRARVLLPAETATAVVPQQGTARRESRMTATARAGVQGYELEYHDGRQAFFFALGDALWNFAPWSSDAQVLYCQSEKDKLVHMVAIGGTFVAWQGETLFKAASPLAFFEWRKQDAMIHAEPYEPSLTSLFKEWMGREASGKETSAPRSRDALNNISSSSFYVEKH